MSEIKAAMDKIAQETLIEVEAPSKKSMTKSELEEAKKKYTEGEKTKLKDRAEKMREAKKLIRDEKIKTGKAVSYKSRTSSINDKLQELDDVKNKLELIIGKLDEKEQQNGLKQPIQIKKEQQIEKAEPKLRYPDVVEGEKNLKEKDPTTPNKSEPINIENKTPATIAIDQRKAFEGYNKRIYHSIHNVPSIKQKKM